MYSKCNKIALTALKVGVSVLECYDDGFIMCEVCGTRVEKKGKTTTYCVDCANNIRRERNMLNMRKSRE